MVTKRIGDRRLKKVSSISPISPLSVVRLVHADKKTPTWVKAKGRTFRVGYYSKQDGLDCVWLVNDEGIYEQTTNHEFLYRYFDVLHFSNLELIYFFTLLNNKTSTNTLGLEKKGE